MTSVFWRANTSCLGYSLSYGIAPSSSESARLKSWWTRPTLQSHASRTGGEKSNPRPPQQMASVHLSRAQVSVRQRQSHEKMGSSCFSNHVPYLPRHQESDRCRPSHRGPVAGYAGTGDCRAAHPSGPSRSVTGLNSLPPGSNWPRLWGRLGIGQAKLEAAESRAAETASKVEAAEAKVEAARSKAIELQRRIDALRLELAHPPKRRW
jgi:hypothetical protein